MEKKSPLLFVHGLCHASWCWEEYFAPYFRTRGYEVESLNLRGHGPEAGRPIRFTPLSTYVEDVRRASERMTSAPIVIGHSMGGAIVQRYLANGGQAAAAVLVASVPPDGVLRGTVRYASSHPLRFAAINATLSFRPMVKNSAAFRIFFSDETPEAEVRRFQAKAQDESYRAYIDMMLMSLFRPRPTGLPMLVVAAGKDALFSPREEVELAKHHGAEFELFPRLGHDMMLDVGWEGVADRIYHFLERLPA
jgi:pimeloyl-ACP methyl ester carboxylesterase